MSGDDVTNCVNKENKGDRKHAPVPNHAVEGNSVIPAWLRRKNALACIAPVSVVLQGLDHSSAR